MGKRSSLFSTPELPRVDCPRCDAEAARAGGKAYCRNCGWNARATEEALRKPVQLLTVHTLLAFVFIVVTAVETGWTFAALYAALILVMIFFGWWGRQQELRKFLRSLPPEFKTVVPKAKEPSEAYLLQSVPRPRRVRLNERGRRQLFAIGFIVVQAISFFFFSSFLDNLDFRNTAGAMKFLFLLHMLAAYVILLWHGAREFWLGARNLRLTREGEVGVATLTYQEGAHVLWLAGGKIRYEFRDRGNRVFQGEGFEAIGKLFEEMRVPVFYDPEDPSRNVVAECTAWEIVLPAGLGVPATTAQDVVPENTLRDSIRGWFSGGRAGS
jgi:hypothetical protein